LQSLQRCYQTAGMRQYCLFFAGRSVALAQ
jgi:hypothetical protein